MSAREVIRLIKALPPDERKKVLAFLEEEKSGTGEKTSRKKMSFRDAKKHVFTTYRDVLEKLAK